MKGKGRKKGKKRHRERRDAGLHDCPKEEEVRVHRVSHMPFRSWCADCVAARGRDWPHRSGLGEEELTVPAIHMDYYFICDSLRDEHCVVLPNSGSLMSFRSKVERFSGSASKW